MWLRHGAVSEYNPHVTCRANPYKIIFSQKPREAFLQDQDFRG